MGYKVVCISGRHVDEAPEGSVLEERCIDRAVNGNFDALILGPDECAECEEYRRDQQRRDDLMVAAWRDAFARRPDELEERADQRPRDDRGQVFVTWDEV